MRLPWRLQLWLPYLTGPACCTARRPLVWHCYRIFHIDVVPWHSIWTNSSGASNAPLVDNHGTLETWRAAGRIWQVMRKGRLSCSALCIYLVASPPCGTIPIASLLASQSHHKQLSIYIRLPQVGLLLLATSVVLALKIQLTASLKSFFFPGRSVSRFPYKIFYISAWSDLRLPRTWPPVLSCRPFQGLRQWKIFPLRQLRRISKVLLGSGIAKQSQLAVGEHGHRKR